MGKRLIVLVVTLAVFFPLAFPKNPSRKFFRKANHFLKRNVHHGKVNYAMLSKDPKKLNRLVKLIEEFPTDSSRNRKQKAFYINAYNILLIKSIVDRFPLDYPLEQIGLFSFVRYKVGEDSLTLNELENQKIILPFKDVRVLFVLSSASEGSPMLASYAYKGRKLEKQFRKRIKKTCDDYSYVRVMNRSSKILMAEAFKRSQNDFNKEDIIFYLNKYRDSPLPSGYTIDFYPADRKINSQN
jgi:hypothetical protein